MKKLIIFLVLAIPALAYGWMNVVQLGGGVESDGASTYIGWANSDGTPTGTPTSSAGDDDMTATTKWTADEGGTLVSLQFYCTEEILPEGNVVYMEAVVYKDKSGTLTLVASGAAASSDTTDATWVGKITLVAESGESLDFLNGDDLYYGFAWRSDNADWVKVGREDSGGTGMWYVLGGGTDTEAPATISLTESAGREMSYILEYN